MSHRAQIVENLSRMLKPPWKIKTADAAVALLLKPANQDFDILFVKRTVSPSDPWSGQIAFPGGKRDTEDENLKQTLVREVLEETNINLTRDCLFLGALKTLKSEVKLKLLVAPFVILLEHEPVIVLNEELEGYLWMSLKKLRKCKGTARLHLREVPAYLVEGSVIWGLTYRILERFTKVLENAGTTPVK